MPRGDGTGPTGEGAMTGRGAGSCTGFTPGVCSFFGFASKFGNRCGLGRRFNSLGFGSNSVQTQNGKEYLSKQAEFLEKQLQNVKNQISKFDEGTK